MDNLHVIKFDAQVDVDKVYLSKSIKSDGGKWVVEAYASTTDLDSQNDIVSPEALAMGADSLQKYSTLLFNHNVDKPIGLIEAAEARDNVLWMKCVISKSEADTWEKVKDGTLSKFSIRGKILDYELMTDEMTKNQILVIKAMELYEVSLVSVPANPYAKALSWYIEKAFNDGETEKVSTEENTIEKKTYRKPGESASACVSRKIKENMKDGMDQQQAVAAAYSMCGVKKQADSSTDSDLEEAVDYLESAVETLTGEDKDEVMSIIRTLTEMCSRLYGTEPVESTDANKGGLTPVADKKEDEIVKSETQPETTPEPVKEPEKVETTPTAIVKTEALDLSGLKDVVVQIQAIAKEVSAQSEAVKAALAQVAQTKEDLSKMVGDINEVVKEIPLRKGQPANDQEPEDNLSIVDKLEKSEDFKKMKPADQLQKFFEEATAKL